MREASLPKKGKHKLPRSKDVEKGEPQRYGRQTVLTEYAKCQQQILGQLHDLDSCLATIRQIQRKLKNRQDVVPIGEKSLTHEKNPLHRYFQRMGYDWTTRFLDQCTNEREGLRQRNVYLEDKTRGPLAPEDTEHPLSGVLPYEADMAERIAAKTEQALAQQPDLTLEDKLLLQAKAGNTVINEHLDTVSYKLSHLKVIVTDMTSEVDAQNKIIPEIQERTEEIGVQMESATNRLHRALKLISQSRYTRYFVLCLVIMGLVVYLLKIVVG
jgi:hypothetical protein